MAVALAALVLALGGTAFAAIQSGDIIDGEVKTQDVANDTTADALRGEDVAVDELTGSDVAQGSLAGANFLGGSLTGADVQSNSLSGADVANILGGDILQGTMADVPAAVNTERLDFIAPNDLVIGRSDTADAGQDECEGSVSQSGREVCADVSVDFPHYGRALAFASGMWHITDTGQSQASAQCGIHVDGASSNTGSDVVVGEDPPSGGIGYAHGSSLFAHSFGATGVTGSLPPGPHLFTLECQSSGSSDVDRPRISAVVVGSG